MEKLGDGVKNEVNGPENRRKSLEKNGKQTNMLNSSPQSTKGAFSWGKYFFTSKNDDFM